MSTLFFLGTDGSDSAVSLVVQAPPNTPSVSPLKQQQSLPAQGSYPASPRVERRLTTPCNAYPNTLTVQIGGEAASSAASTAAAPSEAVVSSAASIPTSSSFPCNSNRREAGDPHTQQQQQQRSRSPVQSRGITYPPPSPKSLKRGVAIQSSLSLKNPPLIKSRPVQQTIPVITGMCFDSFRSCLFSLKAFNYRIDLYAIQLSEEQNKRRIP